ncbi:methylated-DNA--protein-cysteine methyltransferase [Thermococcus paralvinellae]|uniref:Methylated-DNA--protein-cysteine methyltransferase n=1 Tax=Thermococcus paralvinellae TaxID=582419 RepID=W0I4H7_9EURY|nr:methylated-DNA--protein-cysteine methyltransferase [Thermococcus paralvinellae]AHF80939.1 methylated-DNA-protein-cysteine S-methyltransferase [Thermococcus paralvinellae]
MISIEKFEILGREIWIAVIFEQKIDGLTFSLDGYEYLKERINSLKALLEHRKVLVNLVEEKTDYPEIVYNALVGRIENEDALEFLSFRGITPFERKVYEILTKKVKRGSVITYGELAKMLSTSPRAIGNAMRRNPYPIIVPCHRVVLKSGLGNYTPKKEYKKVLLELEGVKVWTS